MPPSQAFPSKLSRSQHQCAPSGASEEEREQGDRKSTAVTPPQLQDNLVDKLVELTNFITERHLGREGRWCSDLVDLSGQAAVVVSRTGKGELGVRLLDQEAKPGVIFVKPANVRKLAEPEEPSTQLVERIRPMRSFEKPSDELPSVLATSPLEAPPATAPLQSSRGGSDGSSLRGTECRGEELAGTLVESQVCSEEQADSRLPTRLHQAEAAQLATPQSPTTPIEPSTADSGPAGSVAASSAADPRDVTGSVATLIPTIAKYPADSAVGDVSLAKIPTEVEYNPGSPTWKTSRCLQATAMAGRTRPKTGERQPPEARRRACV